MIAKLDVAAKIWHQNIKFHNHESLMACAKLSSKMTWFYISLVPNIEPQMAIASLGAHITNTKLLTNFH